MIVSFQIDSFELKDVPQKAVKSQRKCADFEIDLKDLYISDWSSVQIKDFSFSDKLLIDCKWPLHYQLQDKRVLKTSIFREGRLYQCISDGLSCCTSHFRLTALIVWKVPREVVKYERQCAEKDLKDLYYSVWPSIGYKLKASYFLKNALLIANVL